MSTTDKTRRAASAVESARAAADDAKKLAKKLPSKQAKKLKPLIEDAKQAAAVTKKQLADKPRRIERAATEAILALSDATAKLEAKRGASAAKKAEAKKAEAKKAEAKKAEAKKAEAKKAEAKKAEAKKADVKKADAKKSAPRPQQILPQPPQETAAPVTVSAAAVLQGLTVASLRARAKAEGRVGYSRLTKAELIALFA